MDDVLDVLQLGCSVNLDRHQAVRLGSYVAKLKAERDELAAQLVAVKEGGGTGQSPCRKYCESVATWKDYDQLREHADKMKVERDALAAENANLKSDIRQRELIHVGFTNEHQVTYVTEQKEDGAFYPDSDNECYIPLYMLNVHSHRVGPDSEIYKEHCERWRFRKEVAAIRAEAIEASLDAIGAPATSVVNKRDDFAAGFNHCAALLQMQAAKVRQGGE